jgi:DNA-directed RNA polymerase subunit RPC12/RpoP
MKNEYDRTIRLRCATCGETDLFSINENKTYIKCERCGREYFDGENELIKLNQESIDIEVQQMRDEIKNDMRTAIKSSFKGNKFITFK